MNLEGRNIFNIDVSLLNKFKSLRRLGLKDHRLSDEEHEEILLQIINENENLEFLEVDYEVEMQIYEMASQKRIKDEVLEKLLVNGHNLKNKEPTEI